MQLGFWKNASERNTQHFSFYWIAIIAIVMFYFSDVLPLRNGPGNILIDIFFFISFTVICFILHLIYWLN